MVDEVQSGGREQPLPSRIPSLDGLRALSVSLVLFSHFGESWHLPYSVWYVANDYGKVGLRIFYVISGFLITTLLLKEGERTGNLSLKKFYIRRAYRILPAAYIFMIAATLLFHSQLSVKDIVIAFTYLSAYSTYIPLVLSHLWSLSVEEQFYLLWPTIMMFGTAAGKRAALAVVVICPVLRFVLLMAGLGNGALYPVVTSADAIATGCLLALFQPELRHLRSFFTSRRFWIIWVLTAAVALLDLTRHGRIYQCAGLPLLHLGIALCVQSAMLMAPRILNATIPVWVGTISYSLYLWHRPFADGARPLWYTTFPTNLILAVATAVVSYYAIERPILRLRERRMSQRRKHMPQVLMVGASSET
jgi:peptidoglycan/LPS O-acetylase OafA/YrhL